MSDNNDSDNDINSDLLNERIRKYFELKEKYEERRIKLIKNKYIKLKEKGFSKKKIKSIIQNMKIPCIICNNKGGSIFKVENEKYIANCNCENKCKFNIEILKGNYKPTNILLANGNNDINRIKEDIIKTKMKHILSYIDNTIASSLFSKLKNQMEGSSADIYYTKIIFQDILEENNMNSDSKEDKEKIDNILEFKNMINNYIETEEGIKLKEAINFQIENIDNNRREKNQMNYSDTEQIETEGSKIIQYKINI